VDRRRCNWLESTVVCYLLSVIGDGLSQQLVIMRRMAVGYQPSGGIPSFAQETPMVDSEAQKSGKKRTNTHLTKKCPQCYVYLPLSARECPSCHSKVGEVDQLGFAAKPFDWKGYLLAVVAIAGFVIFMWWAFSLE
jgi:hypothetical protein